MPLDEPSWWYGSTGDWRARALQPVANLYGWVAVQRFALARPYRADLPIICVGNFTAGGTGKTPMSLLLAELLTELGERPAFLSRGYAGRLAGPIWVDRSIHNAADVGDEPLLLAAAAPTMVSRDRVAGARAIASRTPSVSVIIMDDGLQNPALEKDLRLAIVDGVRGVGNGRLIPAGPLRAPLPFQFAMTDAIIVNSPGDDGDKDPPCETSVLASLRRDFRGPVLTAEAQASGDTSWLAGARVIAFAGIANPQRFFRLVQSLGAEVVNSLEYRDHHRFTDAEAESLLERAAAAGAQLVTTEKDWVRLSGEGAITRLRETARTLPIRLRFKGDGRAKMKALLAPLFAERKKSGRA